MKSPAELRMLLRRQWQNRTHRESRLLAVDIWPVVVPIGRPSARLIHTDLDSVKRHVDAWRRVSVGEVIWQAVRYRSAAASVDVPTGWKLRKPSEWIEACRDDAIAREFALLAELVENTNPIFHSLLVRRRSLWQGKPTSELIQAAELAIALEPGAAAGRPLRTLSIGGIDTKFFERHAGLITALLDVRFEGEVSKLGLETFLSALSDDDHWLLVIDLDGSLLPFRKQRVRSSEIRTAELPGERLLLVENETCQHLLPRVPGTLAILGSGFALDWATGSALASKRVGYWGDIDTWGLQFLAQARRTIEQLDALMMDADVFRRFGGPAVVEPVVAGAAPPTSLSPSEQDLYRQLLGERCGRLEQEFLPEALIRETITSWAIGQSCPQDFNSAND